jgi:hypothetical protein
MEAGRIGGLEIDVAQVDTAPLVGRQSAESIERTKNLSRKVESRGFPLPPVGRRSASVKKKEKKGSIRP